MQKSKDKKAVPNVSFLLTRLLLVEKNNSHLSILTIKMTKLGLIS